jgi:hypothetical protein
MVAWAVALGGGEDVAGYFALGHGVGARIAHRRADARGSGTGAVERGLFDIAARGRAAEQGVERLLRRGRIARARGALARRDQREIGRHHQRGLALDGEFVGPVAVEQSAALAAGEQDGAEHS